LTRWARRRRPLWTVILAIAIALVAFWRPVGPWDHGGSAGTVPRTPPPTWTPLPRTATPRPTAAQPPPTSAAATPVPLPDAWLGLHAAYHAFAPEEPVLLEITLDSRGGAPLSEASVRLPWLEGLDYVAARPEVGDVTFDGDSLLWQPGNLGAGEMRMLIVDATASADLLPSTRLVLQAVVRWDGEARLSNEVSMEAPPALLPDTGGS
jgi:hypothetical protein